MGFPIGPLAHSLRRPFRDFLPLQRVCKLFVRHPHDQLATDVPISGSFTSAKVDTWEAVGSLLHNAFIRALLPRIDQPIHLQNVDANAPAPVDKEAAGASNTR